MATPFGRRPLGLDGEESTLACSRGDQPSGRAGFLLFPPDWWETAADMPIQLALLQGGSSAFQTGPIAP
jgi:hypothetical protein